MTTTVSSASASQQQQAASTASAEPKKTTGIASDFETFLKMLTAQARYQDPLEPIDSTEYSAQLAQFSMVEQQVQGNEVLEGIQAQLGLANMAAMSGWVGMETRSAAPAYFDGTNPVTVSPNPAQIADTVHLVVKDDTGKEVQRISLPVSAEPYQWQGIDDDGYAFDPGSYSFTLESQKNGEVVLSDTAETYTRVKETQMRGNEVALILEGGSAILASSVTALREPVTPTV
ncbi:MULTISPECIES: flagellar hook capping FlgD N-terminal domain-containing protein [Phaeobacter]|uniref:flagellar hook capping FlgD N-terminal domain-containing protein n=1 Tax=Phaeobacter TaxID=302485 RepID=UPI000160DEF3|nr:MULTISPECIES: flagellar hook capping FlgD N-terminal domain-containing protein [Phaeobacter]AFO89371.1 putative flagellar hook capping protein [Phaeobacter inhibens 2.10]APX16410.1 flagellar basal body rod modification protein [Phaeobacter inhibens]AUQ72365.1 putative flagellar hook capping protein [Phaeobacter inhibens]AXT44072.1 flagellar basal body rod modification protein [Phaeobacter inhibens]MBQ4807811.1 flagellar hook assembly protein FlgD [Phaeobacter sp. HS012]